MISTDLPSACELVVPFSPGIVTAALTEQVLLDGWLGSVTVQHHDAGVVEVEWHPSQAYPVPAELPTTGDRSTARSIISIGTPQVDRESSAMTGLATVVIGYTVVAGTTLEEPIIAAVTRPGSAATVVFRLEEIEGGQRGTSTRVGVGYAAAAVDPVSGSVASAEAGPVLDPGALWLFWLRRLTLLDSLLRGTPVDW